MARGDRTKEAINRRKAKQAGQTPLHEQLLDTVLARFAPHVEDIARMYAEEALSKKGGAVQRRFIIEFIARYADRSDENEAVRELREMTKRLTEGSSFMPPGMEEELKKRSGNGHAPEGLLEPAQEDRVIESDLGSAP